MTMKRVQERTIKNKMIILNKFIINLIMQKKVKKVTMKKE